MFCNIYQNLEWPLSFLICSWKFLVMNFGFSSEYLKMVSKILDSESVKESQLILALNFLPRWMFLNSMKQHNAMTLLVFNFQLKLVKWIFQALGIHTTLRISYLPSYFYALQLQKRQSFNYGDLYLLCLLLLCLGFVGVWLRSFCRYDICIFHKILSAFCI